MAARRDVDGAVRDYRKALELNRNDALAHGNLGGLLVNQGVLEEGVAHLFEAIRLDPNNAGPYVLPFHQPAGGRAVMMRVQRDASEPRP